MRVLSIASILGGLAATTVLAIPTITTKGSKFFTSNGDQWFIKGIAYQLVPADPLVDAKQCQLDADLMKTLGANAIRVYHVDPAADHTSCMTTFANAGIYLFVDLDTFTTQINQDSPTWNQTQLKAFGKVMDEFQKYDNTAGFLVGNEVMTNGNGSLAAPFVKAAVRDMKAYRDGKKYRNIPIGYSAADIATLRPMLQNYLACGDPSSAIDYFCLNAYEWCGLNTYKESGYSQLTDMVTNYSVPIFFSETGCNTVKPRTFEDQAAIFGPEMTPYWSGSIIYEWIEEANNYGIISYGPKVDPASPGAPPDGFTRSGTPTPVAPDFTNLQNQWKTLNPTGIKIDAYSPTLTAPPCPALTPNAWNVNGDVKLPTLNQVFNQVVASSITLGTAANKPTAVAVSSNSTSHNSTGGSTMSVSSANSNTNLQGVGVSLVGILFGFFAWL